MTLSLKPIAEQTIVVTGASSGIGLSTARMAASRGARLVLAARSAGALDVLARELNATASGDGASGGGAGLRAVAVVADVSVPADVARVAQAAVDTFGGFDTWVNNAATGLYGRITEVPVEDMRRLFDTNVWGLVEGSRVAVRHLRGRGGALVNVGSALSDRAIPLQGVYAASKHAVKGFTDALRMELADEGAPVSVSLVKPGAIDTPFPLNARNYLDAEPQHVPPVYAPETVARAILHCAATPTREVYVGSSGKAIAALGHHAPAIADVLMAAGVIPQTYSDKPPRPDGENGLDHPSEHLAERGDYPGHVARTSLYTSAALHPGLAAGAVAAGAALVGGLLARRSR